MYNPYKEYLNMTMIQLSNIVSNCSQNTEREDMVDTILDSLKNQIEHYNKTTGENITIYDYRKR